jgi:hypothetical protein
VNCRHCHTALAYPFLDLGFAPPSNAYLSYAELSRPETYYPLRVLVCHNCWLVQTEDYAKADALFSSDYAYFSSTSSSWLAHAADYASDITHELALNKDSFVIEVASNDGYLLKNFVASGIPCLGIEPTDSTAAAAENNGVNVLREFFGEQLALSLVSHGKQADLIIGNNVYAHVPDINDFTRGLKVALKFGGTITLEFPHLLKLLEHHQFDTVYHEHFSYLSLYTVKRILEHTGLRVMDVRELPTHGGSLRVYACHADDPRPTCPTVDEVLQRETDFGMQHTGVYSSFQEFADTIKNDLVEFLIRQKRAEKKVVAYGAAAKGNTLLNYAGIKPDLLPVVFDAASSKQGRYLPGSHIPIVSPTLLSDYQPDYIVILPWNLDSEIRSKCAKIFSGDVQFVKAIPKLSVISE